jgi:hypothetical protein
MIFLPCFLRRLSLVFVIQFLFLFVDLPLLTPPVAAKGTEIYLYNESF